MDRTNKEWITPVRTRGPVRVRGGDALRDDVIRTPVRTRGAVRTRDGAVTRVPRLRQERSLSVGALVSELREEVGGAPLTVLVHGWGTDGPREFLTTLLPLLRREDALWLVPARHAKSQLEEPRLRGAVILNLRNDTHRRTYRNLIGDIVVFPASEPREGEEVGEWRQRARAMIIDGRGPYSDPVLRAACETRLMTYRWVPNAELEELAL